MKKRIVILLITIIAVIAGAFGFAACDTGNGDNTSTPGTTTPDTPDTPDKPGTPGKPNEKPSTCEHEYDYENAHESGSNGHILVCKKCGNKVVEQHDYADGNLYCRICKFHEHKYEKEIVSDKYLAEKATCEHAAKYYKSCECGEYSPRTFEYGTAEHDVKHVEANAATCKAQGNKEYWSCNTCERYYSDENCAEEIKDKASVITEITDHSYSGNMCKFCGKVQDKDITYDFTLNDDKQSYTLRRVSGSDVKGEMTIPATFNGLPVTVTEGYLRYSPQIYVFESDAVTKVIIPEGVKTIGTGTFVNCTALKSVTIPESVDTIDTNAFYNSGAQLVITVPGASVANEAFYKCDIESFTSGDGKCGISGSTFWECSIKNALFGQNTWIANGAFYQCNSLENITVPGPQKNSYGYSRFGELFSTMPATLKTITVTGTGDTFLGNGTGSTFVSGGYFENTNPVETIILGDGVTTLYNGAFSGCDNLKNLIIGNGLATIEANAFHRHVGIENLTIDDKNPNLVCIDGIIYNKNKTKAIYALKTLQGGIEFSETVTEIQSNAFADCTLITEIILPDGVTSIGRKAFYNCTGLTGITIPNEVAVIGDDAFGECKNIENAKLHTSTLKLITTENLKTVEITGGEEIGEKAFDNCKLESVILPESLKTIGANAFRNCKLLTSIIVPAGVTSISEGAFSGCTGLESITLPFIGGSAEIAENEYYYPFGYIFGNDYYNSEGTIYTQQYIYTPESDYNAGSANYCIPASLKSVTVTGGEIRCGAFYNCSELTDIILPDGTEKVGEDAFYGCDKLNYNSYRGGEYLGTASNPYQVLMKVESSDEIENFAVNDDTKVIYDYAFNTYKVLSDITLPDGLTTIGKGAFAGCNITGFTMPDSVKHIGMGVFSNCNKLTSITLSENITCISNSMFYGCGLTSITIPDGITNIEINAFASCHALNEITIPASVTTMGYNVFYNCNKNIRIYCEAASKPEGWDNEWNAGWSYTYDIIIWDCKNNDTAADGNIYTTIDGINYSLNNGEATVIRQNPSIGPAVVIPDKITYNSTEYEVTAIINGAFAYCAGIESITLPFTSSSADADLPFGYIFGSASYDGGVLTEQQIYDADRDVYNVVRYYIPEALKSVTILGGAIPYGAFRNCNGLESIVLPQDVTEISASALANCSGLKSFTIPANVVSIGTEAFYGCSGLSEITIPENVASIGEYAFARCTGLAQIIIPETVTTLGAYIFSNSGGALTVYCEATKKPEGWSSSWNSTIYNPEYRSVIWNCKNNDKDSNGYAYAVIDGLRYRIKNTAEVSSQPLNISGAITIPEKITYEDKEYEVTAIYERAFYNCVNLIEVVIPDSITSIGVYAFGSCKNLTSVTITNSVTEIGAGAFSGCSKLININIPTGLTKIEANTFAYCYGLTEITIPVSVTEIGASALGEYTSYITYEGTTEQWNAITKANNWLSNYFGDCTVHCTNGDIEIETKQYS